MILAFHGLEGYDKSNLGLLLCIKLSNILYFGMFKNLNDNVINVHLLCNWQNKPLDDIYSVHILKFLLFENLDSDGKWNAKLLTCIFTF